MGISTDYKFGFREKPEDLNSLDPIYNFDNFPEKKNIILNIDNRVDEAIKKAKKDKFAPISEASKHVY